MSAAAFALLHPGVQKAVHRMGWTALQPIQVDAIHAILRTEDHVLISAQTAGGKTEAAFLPVISRLAAQPGGTIRALYVGPLIALINDQFERLERLCRDLEIPVHRWHGGASAAEKKHLREHPAGLLLITPESLESNFINFGRYLPQMYAGLEFIVIDELHSFLGGVRGIHLRSLLHRLISITGCRPRMIGLSATLGDPAGARGFLAPNAPESVRLIEDKGKQRQIQLGFRTYVGRAGRADSARLRRCPGEVRDLIARLSESALQTPRPLSGMPAEFVPRDQEEEGEFDDIASDVVRAFSTGVNLFFGNARQDLEALADCLGRRLAQEGKPNPFMVHHGSVSRAHRAEVEEILKTQENATALCSSTLEMGIDIGAVKRVGQLDPPWSVSSMLQRLGRSGRREGEAAILRLYIRAENPHAESSLTDLLFPSLLRAIAMTRLMLAKWIEPHVSGQFHLSTLVHQILSCLKQTGGMRADMLHRWLIEEGAFTCISRPQFIGVLRSLGQRQVIQQISSGEIILGMVGERITSDFDFYAAFASSDEFAIRHREEEIGKLESRFLPGVGEYLILAGRRWQVEEIDAQTKIVHVVPAQGGIAPIFTSAGGELHTRIVEEMRAVLLSDDLPPYLDSAGVSLLQASRSLASRTGLLVRALRCGTGLRWYPWIGTRTLRTLELHALSAGHACQADALSLFYPKLNEQQWREHLADTVERPPSAIDLARKLTVKHFERFDHLLSEELLDEANAHDRLDVPAARAAAEAALKVSGAL